MKRILVTGASRGIGRAIAIKLVASDTHLLIHGRDRAALEETAGQIKSAGGTAIIIEADLSSLDGINSLIEQIGAEPVDVLVNNAGIAITSSELSGFSDDDWQRMFTINVTASFMLVRALTPTMPRGGSIVNILSTAALQGFSEWSGYCMTKFALRGFSLAIREELRSQGIRVINVNPGGIATEIWDSLDGNWDKSKMMSPEVVGDTVKFALAQPDGAVAEDITLTNIGGSQ